METETEHDLRKLHYLLIKRILPDAEAILHHISILGVIELNFFAAACVVLWLRFVMSFSVEKTRVQCGCFSEIEHQCAGGSWRVAAFESCFFRIPLHLLYGLYINSCVSSHFLSFH